MADNTRKLSAVERMVWAAEFVRRMAPHDVTTEATLADAADRATLLVEDLRYLHAHDRNRQEKMVNEETSLMLDDILDGPPTP